MASIINAATSGGLITTADTSGILNIQTAGTTAITVTAAQNVGIGTSSPPVTLSVAGTIGVFGGSLNGSLGSPQLYRPASDTLAIATGAVERMRIDSSGNLGIGTSSPGGLLQVGVPNTSTGSLRAYSSYVSIDAGYQSSGVSGTAAAPSLIWLGDDNTGIWHPASDTLAISTAGSERARIDSSGNLGIGVTPVNALTSFGYKDIEISKSSFSSFDISSSRNILALKSNVYYNSAATQLYIGNGYATQYQQDSGKHIWFTAPSGIGGLGAVAAGSIVVGQSYTIYTAGNTNWVASGAANNNVGTTFTCTSGSSGTGTATQNVTYNQAMTLDESGNLMVGTSTPSAGPYQVKTYGTVNSGIFFENASAGSAIAQNNYDVYFDINRSSATSGSLVFRRTSSFSESMRIGSNGNVAIGTTETGVGKLNIGLAGTTITGNTTGVSMGAGAIVQLNNSNAANTNSTVMLLGGGTSSTVGQISSGFGFTRENGESNWGTQIRFYTHPPDVSVLSTLNEVMRIDSNGNLLVGATSGSYHTLAKDIGGNFATEIRNSNANPYGLYLRYSGATPNNSVNEFLYCGDTVGQKMSIRSNGGIANYSASNYNLASDLRLKHNIEPVKSYWEVFKAIEWKTWLYNDQTDEIKNIGVIAQELQVLAPEFVCESNLKETPEGELPYLGLWENDLKMAGMSVITELVKRCEQQQALITQLQADVAALKGA